MTRFWPLSAIVFAVVFVGTGIAIQDVPAPGATDAEIRAYFADEGNQLKVDLSTLAYTIGALFLIWCVAAIADRLRGFERDGLLRGVALVSGGAATSVLLTGAALGAVVGDTSDDTERFLLDPNTQRLLSDVAYTLMFETSLPLLAPFVLAVSLAARRTDLLPRRLAFAGFPVAALCLLGFLGLWPVFLLWLIAVSIVLGRSAGAERPRPESAEH